MDMKFEVTLVTMPIPFRVIEDDSYRVGFQYGDKRVTFDIPSVEGSSPMFHYTRNFFRDLNLELTRLEKEYWQTQI